MVELERELRILDDAASDFQDSISYYREQGGDPLAERFKDAITQTLNRLKTSPRMYPVVETGFQIQKARIETFPFSIYFINEPDHVWVIAISHGRRKPGYWFQRLSS